MGERVSRGGGGGGGRGRVRQWTSQQGACARVGEGRLPQQPES